MAGAFSGEELYHRLCAHMESPPSLMERPLTADAMRWLALASTLVRGIDGVGSSYASTINAIADSLPGSSDHSSAIHEQRLHLVLHRALVKLETDLPQEMRGAFLPVQQPADVMASVARVFSTATARVRVVDPYLDEKFIFDFAGLVPLGASLELLTAELTGRLSRPAFVPALRRYFQQHGGSRLVETRVVPGRELHDRLIVIDANEVWSLTQSFNHLAERSPASLSRAYPEIAAEKLAYYTDTWDRASRL